MMRAQTHQLSEMGTTRCDDLPFELRSMFGSAPSCPSSEGQQQIAG